MTDKILEQWTVRSIEDLYKRHEQTVCIIKQLNERIEKLESHLNDKK